jgi:hypothetical protein
MFLYRMCDRPPIQDKHTAASHINQLIMRRRREDHIVGPDKQFIDPNNIGTVPSSVAASEAAATAYVG